MQLFNTKQVILIEKKSLNTTGIITFYFQYREYPADSMVLRNKTSRHILFF